MLDERLEGRLRERAKDAGDYAVVPYAWCREVADMAGVSRRETEIFALKRGLCPSRYERSIGTLGLDGQRKLLEASVAVAGCGGLGGVIVELLARAGVGELILIDGDVFSDNNLNRQILCAESDIGRGKAETARERALAVNGVVQTKALRCYIDEENAGECLAGASLVMDGLDNNRSRMIVLRECRERGIPFVHGAIGGFWAQVGVFFPGDRSPWDGMTDSPDKGLELTLGNPPFTPAFAASLQTALALGILSGVRDAAGGVLHWCDLSELSMRSLKLA